MSLADVPEQDTVKDLIGRAVRVMSDTAKPKEMRAEDRARADIYARLATARAHTDLAEVLSEVLPDGLGDLAAELSKLSDIGPAIDSLRREVGELSTRMRFH